MVFQDALIANATVHDKRNGEASEPGCQDMLVCDRVLRLGLGHTVMPSDFLTVACFTILLLIYRHIKAKS